ncbi:MAG: TetR/AcrR family transcriptional regulator [Rhizobiaceae bacterium]
MKTKKPLNANDWIEAAFRSLTKKGPEGIRAEAIARDLKVSKGSFYWHFKDVPALKKAMLNHWKEGATEAIILLIEGSNSTPEEQLKLLVITATGENNLPYGGALTETAIRDWGRYDKSAARTVLSVDKRRLAYLEKLFTEHGAKPKQARINATILYGALIGLENLAHNNLANSQDELLSLLNMQLNAA